LEKSGLNAAAAALKKVMAAEPAVTAPPATQPTIDTSAVVVNELLEDDK
jgi:hypothetical protein